MKIKTHENSQKNLCAAKVSRRQICAVFLQLFLIFVLPSAIFGETLAKYREAVGDAKLGVEDLLYADDEEMSPAEAKKYERETISEIRAALPPAESVEWQSSTIETDNRWLNEKLDEFEEAVNETQKRAAILTEIDERLGAIEIKLDELETPSSLASNRTKDEDKQKLAEILRREQYQKPEPAKESFFARTWRGFKEWLDEKFPRPNLPAATPANEAVQSISLVLQIILYALVFGVIGFLIYRFAPFFAGKFKGRERKKKGEREILGERIAADETAENLFSEAERMARAGDLRGAVRKGYVALLCELADRKIIGLARHKTNRDYLRDVRPRRELYENTRVLTANFERHWYGANAVEEKDWEEFRSEYNKAIKN